MFYGWTDAEIRGLDWDTSEGYWQSITQIEAQGLLLQARVAQFPWLKANGQRRTHREWYRLAYPKSQNTESLTTEELAERLRAVMNG